MAQTPHHQNPPQITFPKRVGDKHVKAEIEGQIKQVLHVLAPNFDFTTYTLPVHLTKAKTQRADGKVGTKFTNLGNGNYETDLDTIFMNLKIGNAGFDFGMILAHELIHYVQFVTRAYYASANDSYRTISYRSHWNERQAQVITANVHTALGSSMFNQGDEFFTTEYETPLNAYLACVSTQRQKRQSYQQYLASNIETQAFRLTPLVMRACGFPPSKDALRKAREARKAHFTYRYPRAMREARARQNS